MRRPLTLRPLDVYDLERTFNVETIAISVDFNEGKPAFEKIRPHIEDKEIGILGKRGSMDQQCCRLGMLLL